MAKKFYTQNYLIIIQNFNNLIIDRQFDSITT